MVHLGFMLSLLRYFFVLSFLAPTMVKAALLFLFLDLAYMGVLVHVFYWPGAPDVLTSLGLVAAYVPQGGCAQRIRYCLQIIYIKGSKEKGNRKEKKEKRKKKN